MNGRDCASCPIPNGCRFKPGSLDDVIRDEAQLEAVKAEIEILEERERNVRGMR